MKNLLVELFVEELPPKALQKLGDAFATVLGDQLKAQGLATAASVVTPFASPRRLAAHITAVLAQAPQRQAGRGLTQEKPFSGLADALGGEQGVQHYQQVHIKLVEAHRHGLRWGVEKASRVSTQSIDKSDTNNEFNPFDK